MDERTDVWCGNVVEEGEYVSDGRLLFKKVDAGPELLGKLLDKVGISKAVRPLKTQDSNRRLWRHHRKEATRKLYFIKEEKGTLGASMLFIDVKKRPTRIYKPYFQLARKLLGCDALKARKGESKNIEAVVLYKERKTVGLLMPVSTGFDLPGDLTPLEWPEVKSLNFEF